MLIDSWSPRLRGGETYEEASKRDGRNSKSLMEAGGHVVLHTWESDHFKEIFGFNCSEVDTEDPEIRAEYDAR